MGDARDIAIGMQIVWATLFVSRKEAATNQSEVVPESMDHSQSGARLPDSHNERIAGRERAMVNEVRTASAAPLFVFLPLYDV